MSYLKVGLVKHLEDEVTISDVCQALRGVFDFFLHLPSHQILQILNPPSFTLMSGVSGCSQVGLCMPLII